MRLAIVPPPKEIQNIDKTTREIGVVNGPVGVVLRNKYLLFDH